MQIVIHPGTYSVSSDTHQLPAQCLDLLLQLRKLNAQVLTLLCHGSVRRTASWLNVSRSSIIAVVGLGCRGFRQRLRALDAWIITQPDPQPSRPEAIRRLVEHALAHPPKSKR